MTEEEHGTDQDFCCDNGYREVLQAAEALADSLIEISQAHKELDLDNALDFASLEAIVFLEQNRKATA